MILVEQYEQLIERDPTDVSYFWKGSLILAYFLGSVSSYVCIIAYNIFWFDISGGHCFAWANIKYELDKKATRHRFHFIHVRGNISYDWAPEIFIQYDKQLHCDWFQFSCMLSCTFSITWLMMFVICGKGGYHRTLFISPWRVVLPALICSLFMMIVTMRSANNFVDGYFHFTENLYNVVHSIVEKKNIKFIYEHHCQVLHDFVMVHNSQKYDTCLIYLLVQIATWSLTWCWVVSFIILCLRIITSADFSLLKVKIYAIPPEGTNERHEILEKALQNNDTRMGS